MREDRLGLLGGLAAGRPLIVTLVLAFGLTALAIIGAADADDTTRKVAGIPDFLAALLVFATVPTIFGAFAPRSASVRFIIMGVTALVFVALFFVTPTFNVVARSISLEVGTGIVVLGGAFLALGPVLGAVARFAYLPTFSGTLGAAGVLGLVALERAGQLGAGATAAVAFALGAGVGVSALADYARLFARGADGRKAAGVSARYGAAPALYAIALATGLPLLHGVQNGEAATALRISWIAGAAALLTSSVSLLVTTSALAARRSSEGIAVEENRREQAFRHFWRPARKVIAPSSATAFLAVLGVVTVAAAFNLKSGIAPANLAFVLGSAVFAAIVFISLRTGIFLLLTLLPALVLTSWLWAAMDGAPLSDGDVGAVLALSAALYAQLAVAWRDARSPRLNARETTETAMSDGAPHFLVTAIVGAAAFWAAEVGGVWPAGPAAATLLALLALFGLVAAPAVMTALSYSIRRELA